MYPFKYTTQWVLVYSQGCAHRSSLLLGIFTTSGRTLRSLPTSLPSLRPQPWRLLVYVLSRLACPGHFLHVGSYNACPSVSAFLHLVHRVQVHPCGSVAVSALPSFARPRASPLCGCTSVNPAAVGDPRPEVRTPASPPGQRLSVIKMALWFQPLESRLFL